MTGRHLQPIVLPALRGMMGDWIYYSCLMDLSTLANRVDYAEDIHTSTQLSDMIQRRIEKRRAKKIAAYLKTQRERLFNALVVATYRGEPNWHALSSVENRSDAADELSSLDNQTLASVGFLTLRGDERLFAIDGQHRLAGIKAAISDGLAQDPYDKVPVVFVAHNDDEPGLERTRRLFTTLNKTATPVSKGDIIALDEDDVMALCVRWLVDREGELFRGKRIAFVPTNNLPVSNDVSLTTIGNLYDILAIFFCRANTSLKKKNPTCEQPGPTILNSKPTFSSRRTSSSPCAGISPNSTTSSPPRTPKPRFASTELTTAVVSCTALSAWTRSVRSSPSCRTTCLSMTPSNLPPSCRDSSNSFPTRA